MKGRYALGIYTKNAEFLPIESTPDSSLPTSLSLLFLHFVCWLLYLSNQRAADSLTARGLADGNPPTPTDFQDAPAKAIWKYSLKTSIYLAC